MGYERKPQPEMEPEHEPGEEEAGERPEQARAQGSSSLSSAELIGRTLGGRYRFDELLGEGTFARVFRVYDVHRRVWLAAKVLRSDIAHEPTFLERFKREAAVLARLQHPHIVRYYDIVEVDGVVFILTDYIPGDTLQKRLRDQGGAFSPLDSLTYLTPLAAALHFAHQEGVVHRDLKPANILVDENDHLYVMDFGIARILSDTSTLTVDTSVGTPHYMSPEQILAGQVTAATDIYALGVILYQMYTGRLPFTGESDRAHGATTAVRIVYEHLHLKPVPPSQINPRLSQAVEAVILRCLEKDPAQRFASVSEWYDALTAAIGTPSVLLDAAAVKPAGSSPGAAGPVPARARAGVEAEPVPTGVGGASRIVPEAELAPGQAGWARDEYGAEEVPVKPKRKPKPEQGEKGREKSQSDSEKQTEKERSADEKEREKGTEKSDEKNEFWGDIVGSDRLSQVTWGGVILWAGVVFTLQSGGILGNPWAWITGGAGALILAEVAARMVIPEFRSRPGARLLLGAVLLMVGLGIGFSLASLWPLLLIAVGFGLLVNHVWGR